MIANSVALSYYLRYKGKVLAEVSPEKDTVWLDQYQLADLFQTDRTALNRRIYFTSAQPVMPFIPHA